VRKIILVSHGMLSQGMADSVKMILGDVETLTWDSLQVGENPENLYRRIESDIKKNKDDEFVIITDLFGGSVNKILLNLLKLSKVHILSGMHLGLVLSICVSHQNEETKDMIRRCIEESMINVTYANDLLEEVL